MPDYRSILVAVDISEREATQLLQHAAQLAAWYQAKLSVIHVVEPLIIDGSFDVVSALPVELDNVLVERGRTFLEHLCETLDSGCDARFVEIGSIKNEIFRVIEHNGIDLVVLGSHGRHGVSLLFGSTASSVLHGAPCDVLAVRLQQED